MQMVIGGVAGGGRATAIDPDAIKEMQRGQIEQLEFFPELPVIVGLAASWNGKIWVQRRGREPQDLGPIDVLTPAGAYAGTMPAGATEIPDAFGPDGLAAWIESGDFDVPVVVVRRLPAILR